LGVVIDTGYKQIKNINNDKNWIHAQNSFVNQNHMLAVVIFLPNIITTMEQHDRAWGQGH
jgi:hypothetical protein